MNKKIDNVLTGFSAYIALMTLYTAVSDVPLSYWFGSIVIGIILAIWMVLGIHKKG